MPSRPSEFRFSIKYTGEKAARLVSESILQWEVCSIFKDDLTALGVSHPKVDKIQKGPPGSIHFIYSHDKKTSGQHQRYLAVEKTQNMDLHLLAVKSSRSIELITYSQEQHLPTLSLSQRISAPSEPEITTPKRKERSTSLSLSVSTEPSPAFSDDERDVKRPRLTEWSAISEFQQETEQTPLSIRTAATEITQDHPVFSSSSPCGTLPKTPIKIEDEPDITLSSSPSKSISQRSAKITIPLKVKPGKPTNPSRPNAFSAFAKGQEVTRLTRELWDTRRVLSAAQARESTLMQRIELLKCGQSGDPRFPAPREPLKDLQDRLKAGKIELERETKQRQLTEQCLEDVKRECRNPLVVPALLKVFAEIAHLNDVSG